MDRVCKVIFWGAVAVAVLAIVPIVRGDCYRSRAVYQSYSYTPSYSAPAYQSYSPTYVKTYVSPDYYPAFYSSTTDYYRDSVLIQAIAGKVNEQAKAKDEITALKEELQLLRRQLLAPPTVYPQQQYAPQYQQPQQQPPQQTQPYQSPPREQPPPPRREPPPPKEEDEPKKKSTRQGRRLPDASPQLTAAVNQSCLRCHGANFAKDGDGIDLRDLNALDRETRLAVDSAIADGSMPRGGRPLGDEISALAHEFATGRKTQTTSK
jgi:hypothetical protein